MIKELDFQEWKSILKSNFSDIKPEVYYFPEYYQSWQEYENAISYCLYIKEKETEYLYPFLKKEITTYDLDKKYFDIFTAYGYGGILASNNLYIEDDLEKINLLIDDWCQKNSIVSEFIRENFVFNQKQINLRKSQNIQVRTNVYSDLSKEINLELSKSRKRYINIAKRNLLEFKVSKDKKNIDIFLNLYYKTMDKLEADKYYYFNKSYFENTFLNLKDNVEFVLVEKDDTIISAAVCLFTEDLYVYHLGASDMDFLSFKPNDFLFFNIMNRAKELGCKYVSWGGGTTNEEDDSLFNFKKKFGSITKPIYIGKKIHNQLVYKEVEKQWEVKYPTLINKYKNILLKYHYEE